MTNAVVLGDGGSHPGTMITASSTMKTSAGIACLDGDLFSCGIRNHGVTPVKATAKAGSNGRAFLRTGDIAGCGCVLIGTASVKIND